MGADPLPRNYLQQQLDQGRVWVAVDLRDAAIGFVVAIEIDENVHLQELDVNPLYGRKGIGRKLVATVCDWAKQQGYFKVSLSTFRDIEWNTPFYQKLGFQVLDESEWTAGFKRLRQTEAQAGLPIDRRVIMVRDL